MKTIFSMLTIYILSTLLSCKNIPRENVVENLENTSQKLQFDELKINSLPFGSKSLLFFENTPRILGFGDDIKYTDDGTPITELSVHYFNMRDFMFNMTGFMNFDYNEQMVKSSYLLADKFVHKLNTELTNLFPSNFLSGVVISKELSPTAYSIINQTDTLVYFRDRGNYKDFIVSELHSYAQYCGIGIVKNGEVVDCILLSYYKPLLYISSFRVFYIDDNTIYVQDVWENELDCEFRKQIVYKVKNKKFV